MINIYENEDLLIAIDIALKESLYVPGWTLKDSLEGSVDFYKEEIEDGCELKDKILLSFIGSEAVGIVYYNGNDNISQIFVKPKHRRQGVGQNLIKELNNLLKKDLIFCLGDSDSHLLFRKFDFVDCRDF